jgi:hypothetical protein
MAKKSQAGARIFRSAEQWRDIINQQAQSQSTIADFCSQQGVLNLGQSNGFCRKVEGSNGMITGHSVAYRHQRANNDQLQRKALSKVLSQKIRRIMVVSSFRQITRLTHRTKLRETHRLPKYAGLFSAFARVQCHESYCEPSETF